MFTTVSSLVTHLPELDDGRAWGIFNDRYTPLLRQFFRSFSVTDDMARDLAQDTIGRAIAGLRQGEYRRDRGRLRDWMAGIARNVLRNARRKQTPQTNVEVEGGVFWDAQEDPAAREEIELVEQRFDAIWVRARLQALIRLAADSFPRADLRCYFLIEIRKLPIATVAGRLGISQSSAFAKRRAVAEWFLAVAPRFFARWER